MLADDAGTEAVDCRVERLRVACPEKSVVVLAEADTLPLEFAGDEVMPVDVVRGLEREEGADAHHHGAEHFIPDVEVVVRLAGPVPFEDSVVSVRGGKLRWHGTEGGALLHALED